MWRSGYAPVCKTVYSGSIPDVASIIPSVDQAGFVALFAIGPDCSQTDLQQQYRLGSIVHMIVR